MFKTVKLQNSDQTIGKDSGTLCTLSVALSKSLFGKVGVVIFSSVGLMYSIGRRKQTCLAHWHSLILSFFLSLPLSFSLLSLSLFHNSGTRELAFINNGTMCVLEKLDADVLSFFRMRSLSIEHNLFLYPFFSQFADNHGWFISLSLSKN